MKKCILSLLILLSVLPCYADRYKIVELNPSPIKIGNKNLRVGDTFDDTKTIEWTSSRQYMRAENLSTHNLRKFTKDAMSAKQSASIADYYRKVRKLSGRGLSEGGPVKMLGTNKSLFGEKRIALVIGNSEYEHVTYLENAVYDASAVARRLQTLGFDVIACYDAQVGEMKQALHRFASDAESGRYDVAVFYYSGHGIQNSRDGRSYMLPVDISMDDGVITERNCLSALDIRDEIQASGCGVNILLFDACRTNMNVRNLSSDAFSMDPGKNTVVMFSTSNGEQALDKYKGGENGPFASALLSSLGQPGLDADDVFKSVRRQVSALTDRMQTPSISSNLVDPFFFTNDKVPASTSTTRLHQVSPAKVTPATRKSSSTTSRPSSSAASRPSSTTDTQRPAGQPQRESASGYDERRFESAVFDYDKGSYEKALDVFREMALAGHVGAQSYLGSCYLNGYGIRKDPVEAVKWLRKAADAGDARAQNRIGYCYELGQGVPQSITEAAKWYRKSAEQNNASAQHNLGVLYFNGKGVPQSYTEAIKWYSKAASQGETNAQNNLGGCYARGNGVKQSYQEAVRWYRMAAESGNAQAQYNLGYCYLEGLGVTQSKAEALKWFRKSANQGHEQAVNTLKILGV